MRRELCSKEEVLEAVAGLFLTQPFGMPLCKDKQSHLTQLAAEAVQLVDPRSDLGLELLSFRGKSSLISEGCFLLASLYDQFFEGMEMLFKYTFVEIGIVKIWRNSGGVEVFMLEL